MLQLFVAPTPFEGWGERAYDGTSQRQLLAVLIVSVGALALTLCVALLMLFADEPLGPPDQSRFPIPACLISFAAWRGICQGRVLRSACVFYETPSAARQLDPASSLKPAKDNPAECGPGSADAPARQHIRRIVDTQINAANANSYCQQDRKAKKIYFEA